MMSSPSRLLLLALACAAACAVATASSSSAAAGAKYVLLVFTEACYARFLSGDFLHWGCLRLTASRAIGVAIITGACVVKVPQIAAFVAAGSAAGCSLGAAYAELAGYGMSADAGHMTAPNMDGPRRAMLGAMRNAGINADQVDYLNAHGTSTPLGDVNETNAIKAALGDHAKRMVVSSTKSMTGHLLGGAGGIESVFTVLALHHQKVPPTINLDNPDPECDLDYCANTARDLKMEVAVKNNFGFGGTNGTLVFKRI
jgi:hypothetical protein